MRTVSLGATDVTVTPIGLGCWQFSQGAGIIGKYWSTLDQEQITAVVKAALEGGITWFDTAEAYGGGKSEEALATALHALGKPPGSVVVATKWMPLFRTARSIGATIGVRLSRLKGYPIDLFQIHQPISFSPIPAQMKEMAELVNAGKIRAVGVSNFSARQMAEAHDALAAEGIPLATNQVRYSLLDRRIETNGVLETARRLGMTIIAYSPLAQGILSGKFHERPELTREVSRFRRMMGAYEPAALARVAPLIEELRGVARAHNATISEVSLAWLIGANAGSVVVIPGASKPRNAEESAAAMALSLSAREIDRIDSVSREVSRRHSLSRGRTAA